MGHKQTLVTLGSMSAFGCKADIKRQKADIGDSMSAFGVTTDIPGRFANVR